MSASKRNSVEIKITYDAEKDTYKFDSKLKAIYNKAKKAFQIKLPSGKYLLVKPDSLTPRESDVTGIDEEADNKKLLEPSQPPVRIDIPRSPVRRNSLAK